MPVEVISKGFQRASKIELLKQIDKFTLDAIWPRWAIVSPSTNASETYEWMGGAPGMKEWVGPRVIEQLKKYKFVIINKKWQNALDWDLDSVRDNPEIIKPALPGMAMAAADHPTDLMFILIINGKTWICYDEKPFFATDHASFEEGVTYSNLLTGSGVTAQNIRDDFDAFKIKVQKMKRRDGAPMFGSREIKIEILHSPDLNSVMREVFVDEETSAGAKNPYRGEATPTSTGWLEGNSYYPGIVNLPQKPFVHQNREKFTSWYKEDPDFEDKLYLLAKSRYNFGYGHPFLMYMIENL